jgi:hypothetical protein
LKLQELPPLSEKNGLFRHPPVFGCSSRVALPLAPLPNAYRPSRQSTHSAQPHLAAGNLTPCMTAAASTWLRRPMPAGLEVATPSLETDAGWALPPAKTKQIPASSRCLARVVPPSLTAPADHVFVSRVTHRSFVFVRLGAERWRPSRGRAVWEAELAVW